MSRPTHCRICNTPLPEGSPGPACLACAATAAGPTPTAERSTPPPPPPSHGTAASTPAPPSTPSTPPPAGDAPSAPAWAGDTAPSGWGGTPAVGPGARGSRGTDHPDHHTGPGGQPCFTVEQLAGRIPGIEVVRILGQGGMGAVYEARQTRLDRPVALKILSPAISQRPGFAERFQREARALAKLNHPNIVMVHDTGHEGDLFYLVMEFVDGPTLRDVLTAEGGHLAPDRAIDVVEQVASALEYAHRVGVVHRDIKPENILIDRSGRARLADFGLAKLVGDDPAASRGPTLTMHAMGTPHYMAPEQAETPQDVDHRADIFAMGVVLYEALTGELPMGRFALPSELRGTDPALDDVVVRALEKRRDRRYQSASEIGTDVGRVRSGTFVRRTPASAGPGAGPSHPTGGRGTATPPPPSSAALHGSLSGLPGDPRSHPSHPSHATTPTHRPTHPGGGHPTGWTTPVPATATPESAHALHHDVHIAAARVRSAAGWLYACGLMTLITHGALLVIFVIAGTFRIGELALPLILPTVCGFAVMIGAGHMRRLDKRWAASMACICSLLPTSGACWPLLTLWIGIWAILVLNRDDVARGFQARRALARASRQSAG